MTNFISNIDLNRRPDPLLSHFDFFSQKSMTRRVINVAIPFLSLHQGIARAISISCGAGKIYHHLQQENRDLKKLAVKATAIALVFFHPTLSLFLTHGSILASDLHNIYLGCKEKELVLGVRRTLLNATYLGSICCRTSPFLITSLFLKVCVEFKQARFEYKEGRYLEMVGKTCMGVIRSGKICHLLRQ